MAGTALKTVEEQLTCPICIEHYEDPKILPCHHSFCKRCLGRIPLDLKQGKYFLACPSCREEIQLPEGGVEKLQSSFPINKLLDVYKKIKEEGINPGKDAVINPPQDVKDDQVEQEMRAKLSMLQLENKQLHSKVRTMEYKQEMVENQLNKKSQPNDVAVPPPNPQFHPPPHEEPFWFPPHHKPWRGHPPHRGPPPGHHPHHHPHHRPPPPPGHHPHHRPPPPPGHYPHWGHPPPPGHHRPHYPHH